MDKDIMLIYEAVKEKLGTEYENVFYHTMRDDKPGDVGIYIYESANDVEDLSGNEVFNCIKVHVQVNAEQSTEGMRKALKYLSDWTDRMETETSDIEGIEFISAQHVGPRALPIGKNNFNILVCRSLIDLKYTFETNNIRF
jgi:hypothetical protein